MRTFEHMAETPARFGMIQRRTIRTMLDRIPNCTKLNFRERVAWYKDGDRRNQSYTDEIDLTMFHAGGRGDHIALTLRPSTNRTHSSEWSVWTGGTSGGDMMAIRLGHGSHSLWLTREQGRLLRNALGDALTAADGAGRYRSRS